MAGNERRRSPRKCCALALRYRITVARRAAAAAAGDYSLPPKLPPLFPTLAGECLNLSERGICFTARERLAVGTQLEIFLTIPRELTGRESEPVCCRARVTHVEESADHRGLRRIGAAIETFESLVRSSDWSQPALQMQT